MIRTASRVPAGRFIFNRRAFAPLICRSFRGRFRPLQSLIWWPATPHPLLALKPKTVGTPLSPKPPTTPRIIQWFRTHGRKRWRRRRPAAFGVRSWGLRGLQIGGTLPPRSARPWASRCCVCRLMVFAQEGGGATAGASAALGRHILTLPTRTTKRP
jgi:hypothetical protein